MLQDFCIKRSFQFHEIVREEFFGHLQKHAKILCTLCKKLVQFNIADF